MTIYVVFRLFNLFNYIRTINSIKTGRLRENKKYERN